MPKTKKTKKEETAVETITVYQTESFQTYIVRQPYTLTISDYPELQGMTIEQAKDYIKNNCWDMASPSDWADSLGDYLCQQDTIKDKIYDEDSEIMFD